MFELGEKIKVVENTYNGEYYEWDGSIINIEPNCITTTHRRNYITHPQWNGYRSAYNEVIIKHYSLYSNEYKNILKIK
jgi:hypothetical protein